MIFYAVFFDRLARFVGRLGEIGPGYPAWGGRVLLSSPPHARLANRPPWGLRCGPVPCHDVE